MADDTFGLLGRVLENRYLVEKAVGEGGFAVVYRGTHATFEERVAIKCLKIPAHFTHDARVMFIDEFRKEAKLLRGLSKLHPAIVEVKDYGVLEEKSMPYLVLEWLEGKPLSDALPVWRKQGVAVLSEKAAVDLLMPVIEALVIAHRGDGGNRIAHRDIKPENLFVIRTPEGSSLKLLDFGIAKVMQEGEAITREQNLTNTGFNAFSPLYGAPEQFYAKKYGKTGPWTDIHALGLVLVELVSGHRALAGEEFAELLESATAEKRPTPRNRGANVSDEFEALCSKALSVDPRHRYQDANELLKAIKTYFAAKPKIPDPNKIAAAKANPPAEKKAIADRAPDNAKPAPAKPLNPAVKNPPVEVQSVPSSARPVPEPRSSGSREIDFGGSGHIELQAHAPVRRAGSNNEPHPSDREAAESWRKAWRIALLTAVVIVMIAVAKAILRALEDGSLQKLMNG